MTPERRYLADGERPVLVVRRHLVVLAGSASAALVALVAGSVLGVLSGPDDSRSAVDVFVGLAILFFFARFLWRLWQWWVDRVVVTDRRFIEISGVLTRKVATMPLVKVTDMTYRRSLPGRMLGYGDLLVESAGQDQGLSRLEKIPNPDGFYRTVTALATSTLPEPDITLARPFTGWGGDEDTGPLPRVIV